MRDTLSSLGYLIVERGIVSVQRPDVQYRGVDRLPAPPDPETSDSLRLQAWRMFWDSFYGQRIEVDLYNSLRIRDILLRAKFDVEIVEAVAVCLTGFRLPNSISRELAQSDFTLDAILTSEKFIGFDVSVPVATFESLLQASPEALQVEHAVNHDGLLSELSGAAQLADHGNTVFSPTVPYVPLAVLTV